MCRGSRGCRSRRLRPGGGHGDDSLGDAWCVQLVTWVYLQPRTDGWIAVGAGRRVCKFIVRCTLWAVLISSMATLCNWRGRVVGRDAGSYPRAVGGLLRVLAKLHLKGEGRRDGLRAKGCDASN